MGNALLIEPDGSHLRPRRIILNASRARVGSHFALCGLARLVRRVLGLLLGVAETLRRAIGPLALKLGTLLGVGGLVSSPADGSVGRVHRGSPEFGNSNSAHTR